MRKPPLQDVIVRNRDSLRHKSSDVRPVRRRHPEHQPAEHREEYVSREEAYEDDEVAHEPVGEHMHREPPHRPLRRKRSGFSGRGGSTNKKWLAIALSIGAIVILSSIALSLMFAGATITVYPKQDSVTLDAVLGANADGSQNVIAYEKTIIEREVFEEVVALEELPVQDRATGKIIIYNEYSESPQRVIKNTRFKTSDGLVFKTDSSVEIPGRKADGTPGTIEINVHAQEPGEEYNIPPSSFTIPGYEEAGYTSHFENIYGKSVEPMEGGFVGNRRSVDEEEKEQVLQELETRLRDELLSTAFEGTETPEGYHLFREAIFFEFETLPDVPTGDDKVTITLKGKLHGVLFPIDDLEGRLAEFALSSFKDSPVRIENLDELSVSLTPKNTNEAENPWSVNEYTVTVQGKAHFIWEFNEEKLADDFTGKDKDILETSARGTILESYPGIDRLEVSIRPFWKRTFPDSAEDILIIKELDE